MDGAVVASLIPTTTKENATRILYVERLGEAPLAPEIASSLRAMAGRLASLGHDVSEGAMPLDIDGQEVGPRGHAIYTGWVNAIGHPAITRPADPAPDGMPIGAQLVGAWNRDWQLLRFAQSVEQAFPFANRWPALALDA